MSMLYTDERDLKLHIVANNPKVVPGMHRRAMLTVNHSVSYNSYYIPPSEENILQCKIWKIAGDKRLWKVIHAEHLLKPVVKDAGMHCKSFFVILEQIVTNPEKDLVPESQGSRHHLRKFNNLIVEEEV